LRAAGALKQITKRVRRSKRERPKKGGLAELFDYTPSFSPSRPARGFSRARERASRGPDGCAAMACLRIGQSRPRKNRRAIMSNHNLFTLGADGAVIPASSETILSAARKVLAHRVRRGASLQSPQKTGEYLTARLGLLDYEVFGIILLDKRHRVIECVDLFRGTIDGASVHPREVVKLALQKSAAACIVYHNHPSGVQEPSQADEMITARVKEALALIDVRLIDHLILAGPHTLSFAQQGLL
jgi:DNA repair protein RadC